MHVMHGKICSSSKADNNTGNKDYKPEKQVLVSFRCWFGDNWGIHNIMLLFIKL